MAKVRINIELDDKVYEQYKQKFNDLKKSFPMVPFNSVEEFIAQSLETLQGFDGKIADLTKKIDIDLADLIEKSGADIASITEMLKKDKTEAADEEKKEEKKESLD
ncbi:MAG: hypothetical protein LBV48_01095 [Mycoplasmataceae bacterium]|jgi:flagellar biosynthesis chaperone FliJ|nr:hypothetical protein [Mycoplasmataceae bacterium]